MRSYTSHPRIAGTEQLLLEGEPSPLPFGRADFFVIALLLLFGIRQFFLYEHTNDFVHEDVGYYENARSLVEHHTYGFNHTSERVQPPGLPLIIGVLCLTTGCSHAAVLRNMPVFLTLGLIVAYVLLRQERGRLVAASSCLLVASAPEIFVLVTRWIYPAFPYLLTSMLALWVTTKLEHADTRRARFWLSLLLSVLLATSVLIQSSGMALLIGLVAWMAVAFFADPGIARSRLKTFLPVLILPLIVLAFWMPRGGNSKEWPLSGYPGSYLTQLRLKSGNYPELGQASFLDIPRRVSENARSHASFLSEVLSPIWIDTSWSRPLLFHFAARWTPARLVFPRIRVHLSVVALDDGRAFFSACISSCGLLLLLWTPCIVALAAQLRPRRFRGRVAALLALRVLFI